jgi:uncharacterized protein (DUF849 family)
MSGKRIITAAITGAVHTPSMSPYLPVTPQKIADDAIRAYEAGAAICHIHARKPETGQPCADFDTYEEIINRVKSKCNMVICLTTGGQLGMSVEERLYPLSSFKPELASFNAGSCNFALFRMLDKHNEFAYDWESKFLTGTEDLIFPNTFKSMKDFTRIFRDCDTKPEFEIYDSGMVNNVAYLIERGYVKKPVYIQFVMGILGGITATVENLIFMVEYAKKLIGDFEFSAAVAGRDQFPLCTQALLIGGHIRVGLEDNLYIDKGVLAKSSGEQVAKMVRIAKELGIEPASPDEARKILGLKDRESSTKRITVLGKI